MPGTITQDRMHPHATSSRYSTARIDLIPTRHSYSSKGTRIVDMITLMLDKHSLEIANFSM
jgi:hypothetical protein